MAMRLHIIARGKIGRSAEAELVDRYLKRISWPTRHSEMPDKGGDLPSSDSPCKTIILDEKGEQLGSVELARLLERWRDDGVAPTASVGMPIAAGAYFTYDGDLKATYDGFAGNLYVSARNPIRPLVLNSDKSPLTEADGKPYAGCYVNVSLELWAQDNNYGKRVNATLMGVQFYCDGDAFAGGGVASEDDFDDVSNGATADDLA